MSKMTNDDDKFHEMSRVMKCQTEMQKRKKIARMNISAQKISTKLRISRHFEIRAKTA